MHDSVKKLYKYKKESAAIILFIETLIGKSVNINFAQQGAMYGLKWLHDMIKLGNNKPITMLILYNEVRSVTSYRMRSKPWDIRWYEVCNRKVIRNFEKTHGNKRLYDLSKEEIISIAKELKNSLTYNKCKIQ